MDKTLKKFPPYLIDLFTPDKIEKLIEYADLISQYNAHINLISRKDVMNIWENHISPSIVVDQLVQIAQSAKVVDVGSGGGFPAIPLKIIRPDLKITLIDSVRKKTLFLKKVITALSLSEMEVLNVRIGKDDQRWDLKNKFDVLTVRGVASFDKLISEFRFLLQAGGYMLIWKGVEDLPELRSLEKRMDFHCEIFSPPENLTHFSAKIKSLRIIKISSLK